MTTTTTAETAETTAPDAVDLEALVRSVDDSGIVEKTYHFNLSIVRLKRAIDNLGGCGDRHRNFFEMASGGICEVLEAGKIKDLLISSYQIHMLYAEIAAEQGRLTADGKTLYLEVKDAARSVIRSLESLLSASIA